jgi:hypothetical protein
MRRKSMARMGKYCKAYPIVRFREYPSWVEKAENARSEKKKVDGVEVETPRPLTDGDFLYLQENYVVTDGIFLDEHVIFENLTGDWINFCKDRLRFEIP